MYTIQYSIMRKTSAPPSEAPPISFGVWISWREEGGACGKAELWLLIDYVFVACCLFC